MSRFSNVDLHDMTENSAMREIDKRFDILMDSFQALNRQNTDLDTRVRELDRRLDLLREDAVETGNVIKNTLNHGYDNLYGWCDWYLASMSRSNIDSKILQRNGAIIRDFIGTYSQWMSKEAK